MQIYLAEQTACFLQSILLGAALALLYDGFRILRMALPHRRGVVFAEDVLFFLLCALCTFFFLMRTLDGQVRFFLFVGEGLGVMLYSLALSGVVMGLGQAVIDFAKRVLRFFYKWFLRPLLRLVYWICRQILRPVRFLGRFCKKSAQRCKYRLKIMRKVLYNQLRSVKVRKNNRKPQRDPVDGQKETIP